MKELTKQIVQEARNGYLFSVNLSGDYEYKIQVDLEGNILMADYGSMNGWCTSTPDSDDFNSTVIHALRGILENDKKEFINMRQHLNPKWKEIAESLRKAKMAEWDF